MSKKINPNLVKIHRNYSVEEVAHLLAVHKNTVRAWLKKGLVTIDNNKPALVLGSVLKQFLKVKRKADKKPCKLEEIYCMRCRIPQKPVENMVNFRLKNSHTGCITGLCPKCHNLMNKFISIKKLSLLKSVLDVTLPQDEKHIINSNQLPVNSDLK